MFKLNGLGLSKKKKKGIFGFTCPLGFAHEGSYSTDDTSHARLWHDFLHNCSEDRFATSLSILFGNCIEEIGVKN